MINTLSILVAFAALSTAAGFVTQPPGIPNGNSVKTTTKSLMSLIDPSVAMDAFTSSSQTLSGLYPQTDPELAKGQFFFFFFAGSGAGGLGLSRVPAIYKELQAIRKLANQGPTLGGEPLPISGVVKLFYPDPISQNDEAVLAKVTTLPVWAMLSLRTLNRH